MMVRNEWVMKSALSVCLLSALAWLFSVLTFHLVRETSYFLLACAAAAVIYPLILGVTRAGMGFWNGLLLLLLILLLAQTFAEGVYFWKMNAIHHDEGEAFVISLLYLGASFVAAALFYPLGFWVPRWFKHR
jgi:riboflavin transporter FmnP